MGNPLGGINEKLKRSREHIFNLQIESDRFFQESGYAVIPQEDMQLLLKAFENLEKLAVPLRFSILAGEIVHHLRSCLDHIVWQFSSPDYRSGKDGRFIEFPVLESRPRNENRLTSYERKIKGVSNVAVLDMIERLQPYNSADPATNALLLLHNMDITDKHKELVLCVSSGGITVDPHAFRDTMMRHLQGIITEAEAKAYLKNYAKFAPMIALGDFGQGKPKPLIPLLYELHNFVAGVVASFSAHLPSPL
ncbi:MAG: hypothetical protein ABSC64_22135 [Candidatus Korobacteraceae bacterium]|jgi:hypothetical protein